VEWSLTQRGQKLLACSGENASLGVQMQRDYGALGMGHMSRNGVRITINLAFR